MGSKGMLSSTSCERSPHRGSLGKGGAGWLPADNSALSEYCVLGGILAWAVYEGVPVGPLFDRRLVPAMLALTERTERSKLAALTLLLPDFGPVVLLKGHAERMGRPDLEADERCLEVLELYGVDPGSDRWAALRGTVEEGVALDAVAALGEGFYRTRLRMLDWPPSGEDEWPPSGEDEGLRRCLLLASEPIRDRLEGAVDPQRIVDGLTFADSRRQVDPPLETIASWVREWLLGQGENEVGQRTLRRFLEFVTAQPAIVPGTTIRITITDEWEPSAATCFRTLRLHGAATKEELFKDLDWISNEEGGGSSPMRRA